MNVEKQLVLGVSEPPTATPLRPNFDHGLARERSDETLYARNGELFSGPNEQQNQHQLETSSSRSSISIAKSNDDIEKAPDSVEPDVSRSRDPNLVDWDGPSDPDNPQNWSVKKKWYITMMLSCLTFCITFSSSVFSQATVVTAEVYDVSTEVTTLATSLFVLVCP